MSRPIEFHPTRAHLVSVAIFAMFILMAIGRDWWLSFLFIIPAVFAYWVLASKTTITDDGIRTAYAFRKGQSMRWEEFSALRFQGATAYAVSTSGATIALPGITFNSIPRLSRATDGRIPDVISNTLEDMTSRDPLEHEPGTPVEPSEHTGEHHQ
ncbi:MAG: PH domain-containing protein [Corynebacterium sp.]|nr:PH domain-containing protein [Corynebacterium sp.]